MPGSIHKGLKQSLGLLNLLTSHSSGQLEMVMGMDHTLDTASTIVGSMVANVSLFSMASGTARGGAPNARLAIYKACWFHLCSDADILSALDDSIGDGVDILSLSLGPDPPQPICFENAISIGTFHAFQRGILVSASAGNSGLPRTATNVAPWILTVAASTVDREFNSNIYLGNSKVLKVSLAYYNAPI